MLSGIITTVLMLLFLAGWAWAWSPRRKRDFDEAAQLLTGRPDARAADGAAWLHDLGAALAVPGLAAFGLSRDHFPELIAKAQVASSMKGNPVALTEDELLEIVERAL